MDRYDNICSRAETLSISGTEAQCLNTTMTFSERSLMDLHESLRGVRSPTIFIPRRMVARAFLEQPGLRLIAQTAKLPSYFKT